MTKDLLFIYGTLLLGDNKYAQYLRSNSEFVSDGSFPGRLYDLGDYPGAIYLFHQTSTVKGQILKLTNPEKVLEILDEYEEVDLIEPDKSLYKRELIDVNTTQGFLKCWVYLYNRPIDDFKQILTAAYLK